MVSHHISTFFKRLSLVRYQFLGMALTSLALFAILYKPITEFNTTDAPPAIQPNRLQDQRIGAEAAVPVEVGMLITDFPAFDMVANHFIADLTLWFEFDPSLITVETLQKFSFERGTILFKSDPDMKIINNKLFVSYNVRLQFSSNLDHQRFPLNDHRLYITFKNNYVTPQEVVFMSSRSSFKISPDANTQDWTAINRSSKAGYFIEKLDERDNQKTIEYPGIVFAIDLAKKGIRKFFIILLPMAILFFISLFTFALDPDAQSRSILTLSTGTLSGLIAYRFVIEKVVPDVGYFTFADHMFNLFLMVIFLIFLTNIFVVNRGANTPAVLRVKGSVFILIQVLLIVVCYVLLKKPAIPASSSFNSFDSETILKRTPGVTPGGRQPLPGKESLQQAETQKAQQPVQQKSILSTKSILSGNKKQSQLPTKQPIVFGCTLDLSKTSSALGRRLKEGLELRINKENLAGGINGHPIKMIFLDDKYTPRIAKRRVLQLMDVYKTNALLSPLGTPTTEVFLPLVEEKKLLVLFPYTGAMIFRKPTLTYMAHLRTSYANEAKALIEYAYNTLQARKFAVFYQDDSYGQAPLIGAREAFKKYNITDVLETSYLRNNPNIEAAARKITDHNPDVILFFSTPAPSAALIRSLGINKIANTLFMGISFLTDVFRNFLRSKGLELIMARVIPNPAIPSLPIVKEYQADMKQFNPHALVSSDSLEGYLNASVLIHVLNDIKGPITNEAIIKKIESIKHVAYKGLMLNFDPETRELLRDVWIDPGHGHAWILSNHQMSKAVRISGQRKV